MVDLTNHTYWDYRGELSYYYRGETFYTVTPIPYYYRRRAILLNLMSPLIARHKVKDVCDFGCGDGYYLQHFGKLFPEKGYYGVDLSPRMIEIAKQRAPFAHFSVSQSGIDFDGIFDMVYAVAVFAHIHDAIIPALLKTIHEKMQLGGKLVLFEQTGALRRDGETWFRRTTAEYISVVSDAGFLPKHRCLIAFPAHRLFERYLAPILVRVFVSGRNSHDRSIAANRLAVFRGVSWAFLQITKNPIRSDNGLEDGNTFYIFEKNEAR